MSEAVDAVPEDLPLTEAQIAVERCVEMLGGRIKHCGRNAFSHLRKAWKLYPVDKEMSLFRAITAEEEAATALILALRQRGYPGADRLDFRRHDHKAGVTPFLQAVGKVLAVVEFARPRIRMSWRGSKPRMDVYFSAVALGLSADPDETVYSDDPFDFVARSGAHGEEGEVVTFAEELADIASKRGASEIFELIRTEANLRNVLLYAQDSGIPKAEFDRALLLHRMMRACVILQVTIAILQTSTLQTFVIQCVEAYLAALKKVSDQGYDFAGEEQSGDQLRYIVKKLDGGPAVAEVEMTREVRLNAITVTADTIGFNMTGLNDGRAYGVEFRERSSQDPEA